MDKFRSVVRKLVKEQFATYELNALTKYSEDTDTNIFLQKVKDENPEMFIRFLTLVRNKGINVAKSKYQEFDKEYIAAQNKAVSEKTRKESLISSFVRALPKAFPQLIKKYMIKLEEGYDGTFYFLIGKFINKYGERYGFEKADMINDLINDDEFEDYFFNEIDNKYGKGIIEW
jgi:hypothetical protein